MKKLEAIILIIILTLATFEIFLHLYLTNVEKCYNLL